MDKLMNNILEDIGTRMGKDPQGWDKPMSEDGIKEFLKFNNNDRSINTVNLSPAGRSKSSVQNKTV